MTATNVHNIRNLVLLGQAGAGKTTLLDRLLAESKAIPTAGSIDRGDTVSDFDALEKQMGHSLQVSAAHVNWSQHLINLLDAPGTPDFWGRALAAMEAVETAAVVINAQHGIEAITRRAMEASRGMCRLLVINRIDAEHVDLEGLMERLTTAFGRECLPVNLPTVRGQQVVDCLLEPQYDAEVAFSSVRTAHDAIVDQVVELDDALMDRYLEQGQALQLDQLHDAFEAALRQGHLIPVCFVSAKTGAGVRTLLDVLARLMPDPTEGNPPRFLRGEESDAVPVTVSPDPAKHVVAHAFQVQHDAYRGKVAYLRVWQGTLNVGGTYLVGDKRKPIKLTHIYRLQGKEQLEVDAAGPGEIVAVTRIDDLHRDAVVHDSHEEDHHHLLSPLFPQPLFGQALMSSKHGDEQKLSDALHRLREEDPCLAVEFDPLAKETVVRGLGATHLRTVLEILKARWGLQLDTKPPAVPYRETIAGTAESRYRHRKQTGGAGQFGEVALRVAPRERGAGFHFVDGVRGGVIPNNFIPAVEKGVRQGLAEGAIAGFPIEDIEVTLFDGKYHPVDSNEVSFMTAGRQALLEAVREARPVLLEPLMDVQVRLPDARFGDVSGEIAARRGKVTGTDIVQVGVTAIDAVVPMAELEGFEPRLKAMSAGEATATVGFNGYEAAPEAVKAALSKAYEARRHGEHA